jgi:gamma-glutamyltranspeptidase/glutathione hydrolase
MSLCAGRGLRLIMGRATVWPMMKRIFAVTALFCATLPSLAAAQAVASSADPRASDVGRQILHQGGSAADAAAAMVAVLTLVEPQSSGIGGGGFLLYHQDGRGISTVDGRETAPAAAKADRFLGPDGKPRGYGDVVPGGLSVGVPGNVRLMEMVHGKWGKLEWAQLFAPAIKLADEGFEVTPVLHNWLVQMEQSLTGFPAARALYYPDGKPAPVGMILKNPDYAAFLRRLAAEGPDAFYRGDNAAKIQQAVAESPRNPAVITQADLDGYKALEKPALCTTYRVYKLCGMGPPSSGATTVFGILSMLEGYNLKAMGKDNGMSWHLLAEAMQLAYADRDLYGADGEYVSVPVRGLLDKGYLAGRAGLISPYKPLGDYQPGTPPGAEPRGQAAVVREEGTTHFAVVDHQGNVASMTSTVESIFGSQLIANGYFLNNELTDFALDPAKDGVPAANRLEAGKRPLSSMSPTIVYGPDGKVVMALGSAGGRRIIMHVAKTLIGVLDWGLSARDAIALPNIFFGKDGVLIEDNAEGRAIAAKMPAFGYEFTPASLPSKLNAVERTDAGWVGAADPRGPGSASVDGSPPQG